MRKFLELAVLVLGLLLLAAAFGLGWFQLGVISNRPLVMRVLIAAIATTVVLQTVMVVLSRGTDRSRAVTFGALLILGYSIIFFDIFFGLFLLPLAVVLLIVGLWQLTRQPI